MDEKITLSDGTEFAGYALNIGDLFLYLYGSTMPIVFNVLFGNTGDIVYTQANGDEVTFTGFTKLVAVRDEGNNLITAVMKGV